MSAVRLEWKKSRRSVFENRSKFLTFSKKLWFFPESCLFPVQSGFFYDFCLLFLVFLKFQKGFFCIFFKKIVKSCCFLLFDMLLIEIVLEGIPKSGKKDKDFMETTYFPSYARVSPEETQKYRVINARLEDGTKPPKNYMNYVVNPVTIVAAFAVNCFVFQFGDINRITAITHNFLDARVRKTWAVVANVILAAVFYGCSAQKDRKGIVSMTVIAWIFAGAFHPGNLKLVGIVFLLVLVRNIVQFAKAKDFETFELSKESMTLDEAYVHTWGTAGGHVGANTDFGDLAEIGAQGEIRLGSFLEALTNEYPFVRVFHGLCFTPDKRGADIDHIAVIGEKVYLLDAKNWRVADYEWSPNGKIGRDGGYFFPGCEVHMDSALQKWERYLAGYTGRVFSRIVLSGRETKDRQYRVNNNNAPTPVLMRTIDMEMRELSNEAANMKDPFVDAALLERIRKQLQ